MELGSKVLGYFFAYATEQRLDIKVVDAREPLMQSVHSHPASGFAHPDDCLHFCMNSAAINLGRGDSTVMDRSGGARVEGKLYLKMLSDSADEEVQSGNNKHALSFLCLLMRCLRRLILSCAWQILVARR